MANDGADSLATLSTDHPSPGADLLAQLGLEHRLERLGHSPYHGNLSLWGSDHAHADHFLCHGRRNGWHLDRAAFDAWLRREAVSRKAGLVSPGHIDGIVPAPDGWVVQVRGMGAVAARVLVDASGRRSALATRLGVRRRRIDGLLAMATHTGPAPHLAGLSLVESFADGWWYAAGLPDGRTLVALMTDADVAKAHDYPDAVNFLQAWRETRLLSHHVQPPDASPPIHGFAAQSGFIEHAAGDRWIAVGDALMGFDPLTSAGICGALHDAIAAVSAITGQLDGDTAEARGYPDAAKSMLRRFLSEHESH